MDGSDELATLIRLSYHLQEKISTQTNREMEGDKTIEIRKSMEDREAEDTTKPSSQLESMEEKANQESMKGDCSCSNNNNEEIIKELKNIKKQNTTTHWLISTMIVLTVAWQLSEVSLILKIKNGFTNPFKSVRGIVGSFLKKRQREVNNVIHQASEIQKPIIEPNFIPNLKTEDEDKEKRSKS